MEVTRIGMPPTRNPLNPERLAQLQLAQRGVALCENDQARGARLIVRMFRALIALIFECESAELRLEIAQSENLRLRQRIAELEGKSDEQEELSHFSAWDAQPTKVGRVSEIVTDDDLRRKP